ncbi:hypothetical protein CEN45_03405 [Fischerella thermalis CCMEE 5198]|nr:hypothetical protein CI594_00830 [Fischerella thermalis CCMEE 5196]PMB26546.1 hypothetical protein CEN45_03405 [Fischerella thermalis CCMEE 5198]
MKKFAICSNELLITINTQQLVTKANSILISYAQLSDQFDAVIHIDDTRGVELLDRMAKQETGEVPETFLLAFSGKTN